MSHELTSAGYVLTACTLALCLQLISALLAGRFLLHHDETPLSAVWPGVRCLVLLFPLHAGLLAWLNLPWMTLLFFIICDAFLSLFIFLDTASRCLPRCFTVIFCLTGAAYRFMVLPGSLLPATFTALVVFFALRILHMLAYRRGGSAQFGLGDVYLMAGLGMWFSFPDVLWLIIAAAVSGGLFLLVRQRQHPVQWQTNVNYRSVPFAPFLCGLAVVAQILILSRF